MLPLAVGARRGGARGEAVPAVRQSRQPRPVLDLHRSAARPVADLRGRGRRRSLGAGARRGASRPVSRAGRHAVGAVRRGTGGPECRPAAGAHRRGRRDRGDPGARRHGGRRHHRALADRPAEAARRRGDARRRRACRSAARSTCWTTARWPRPCARAGRRDPVAPRPDPSGRQARWRRGGLPHHGGDGAAGDPRRLCRPAGAAARQGRRIVIIGAGIAGMVLAWELRKAGYCTADPGGAHPCRRPQLDAARRRRDPRDRQRAARRLGRRRRICISTRARRGCRTTTRASCRTAASSACRSR